ncbi:PREDICTED: tetratricopeptide repeat protein 1-like [Camelina sativa]|uniref:Tetratricopeptide repeat protein 1-like n=1 Tax=Camelina sativa TaxID=90675 RepID=A0ABM0UK15_CAMSA|nr:PREDICTED: tetratricopeptide repeat protein 1-like [Camelina sativa]
MMQPLAISKQVDGDDSDGFETASEREISDEEGDEDCTKNDAVTSQEEKPQHSEKKKEQVELMSGGEAITDDGSNKEKAMAEANEAKAEGNKLFVNGFYEEALSKYAFALELVKEFPESIELRSICHLNRVEFRLKMSIVEHFEDAVTDLKKILELDPSSDHARKGIRRLEPLAAKKREKMKEEAITKLKEMGNSILGRFGMSVDNFKAVKDPNTQC